MNWQDYTSTPLWQQSDDAEKEHLRYRYWKDYLAPTIPEEHHREARTLSTSIPVVVVIRRAVMPQTCGMSCGMEAMPVQLTWYRSRAVWWVAMANA